MGNHSTDRGKPLPNPATPMYGGAMGGVGATRLGNEVALNVGGGGPGTGRTVHATGGQGTHGPVAPGNPTHKRGSFG
jgi:hypothetical protein